MLRANYDGAPENLTTFSFPFSGSTGSLSEKNLAAGVNLENKECGLKVRVVTTNRDVQEMMVTSSQDIEVTLKDELLAIFSSDGNAFFTNFAKGSGKVEIVQKFDSQLVSQSVQSSTSGAKAEIVVPLVIFEGSTATGNKQANTQVKQMPTEFDDVMRSMGLLETIVLHIYPTHRQKDDTNMNWAIGPQINGVVSPKLVYLNNILEQRIGVFKDPDRTVNDIIVKNTEIYLKYAVLFLSEQQQGRNPAFSGLYGWDEERLRAAIGLIREKLELNQKEEGEKNSEIIRVFNPIDR